ncbi:energy transducer TonB [Flammeovirga sp. OC4]|uniref:energy transducer TonB n=1 Tax=Flammeovirga sp. OC4 TaxID=1382345 RepID=UPI0005C52C0F|nr:hypothetical protein [Flammeovirga sp. OC4]
MRAQIFTSCILVFILSLTQAIGQSLDTVYYGIDGIVSSEDSAFFVRYVHYDEISKKYKYRQWSLINLSHGFEGSGELLSLNPEIIDGKIDKTDELGNQVTYLYEKNKFIDIISYKISDNESVPIYPNYLVDQPISVDELIETGNKLYSKLSYQVSELKDSSCRLLIQFVIEKDGSISNGSVRYGCAYKLEPYILEELNQMTFKPARHKDKNIRVLVFTIVHEK